MLIISKIKPWIPAIVSTVAFWWWSDQIIRVYDYRVFVLTTTVFTIAILLMYQSKKCSSLLRAILFGLFVCYAVGLIVNTLVSFSINTSGLVTGFLKVTSTWKHTIVLIGYPILLGTLLHGALLAFSVWLFTKKR